MGTNFYYWNLQQEENKHIGKRSAAGMYCFDCNVSLCKEGAEHVHYTYIEMTEKDAFDQYAHMFPNELDDVTIHRAIPKIIRRKVMWHNECPICGTPSPSEELTISSVGLELGFNKGENPSKNKVRSCSSFSWAISPSEFSNLSKDVIIRDEYNRQYTLEEFKAMLDEYPIKFTDSIGQEFS